MGWPKYHEDDLHIYYDRIYTHGVIDIDNHKEKISQHKCPYCNVVFETKGIMFSHIRHAHSITGPLLFINGTVAKNKDTLYVSEVRSAYVKLYGYNYRIIINDEIIDFEADEDSVELSEIAAKYLSDQIPCIIRVGDNIAVIKKFSLYSIDQNRLKSIICEWENNVRNGVGFKPFSVDLSTLNTAEVLYLEGVYNYFVACQANGDDKANRYYEANSILEQFAPINSFGLCIRKIIAFKLNWIDKLKELCDVYGTNDDFDSISCFFRNEMCDATDNNESELNSIFMEDELQEIYDAILAFNKRDYTIVKHYLDMKVRALILLHVNLPHRLPLA